MISINWFECSVTCEKMAEGGATKKEIERYLVDALTFTDAETRIIEEVTPFCNGHLTVKNITRSKYNEIITSDSESADKWYNLKYNIITLDEKTMTEKKAQVKVLVQAASIEEAMASFKSSMKSSMLDYEISAVQETKILDIFPLKTDHD